MNKIDLQPFTALLFVGVISDRKLLAGLCALAFLAILLANREFRKAFWAPAHAPEGGASAAPAMLRRRLLIVYALAAVILGGSAFDSVTDTEHWPFSQYPMFSMLDTAPNHSFTMLRLYGVTEWQPLSEFPLDKNEYMEPFDNSRMPAALARALQEHRLTPALEDCLQRYDALRASGIHNGPALRGLRLYRVTWISDPQARNASTPNHKELLGEVADVGSRGQQN
jgi:hypothetical protein